MDALAPYLERAGQGVDSMKQHAGAGMDKLKELWSTGVEGVNEAGRATGRGALNVNNFLKDNPVTAPAIGAGVGGLAGALSGKSENKETGEKGTRGRNALIGMLLGGGAGAGAHALASGPGEQALMQLRTQGVTPRPEYTPEASQGNPLQMLKQLGLAPLNVGQNAPPSSLSVKPRF
ncbi:hypothetical protein EKK58_00980 [Candidatus Dependentiae bacterium]|nr:MAG: hypothetical protein EKK58_00980 [Candidatus Dependentiae bacterium]